MCRRCGLSIALSQAAALTPAAATLLPVVSQARGWALTHRPAMPHHLRPTHQALLGQPAALTSAWRIPSQQPTHRLDTRRLRARNQCSSSGNSNSIRRCRHHLPHLLHRTTTWFDGSRGEARILVMQHVLNLQTQFRSVCWSVCVVGSLTVQQHFLHVAACPVSLQP